MEDGAIVAAEMVRYLAQRHVDEVLTRQIEDVACAHSEELAAAVHGARVAGERGGQRGVRRGLCERSAERPPPLRPEASHEHAEAHGIFVKHASPQHTLPWYSSQHAERRRLTQAPESFSRDAP